MVPVLPYPIDKRAKLTLLIRQPCRPYRVIHFLVEATSRALPGSVISAIMNRILSGPFSAFWEQAMPQDEHSSRERPALEAPYVPPQALILRINGTEHQLDIEPRVTLLDALREVLHLTGTKKGCDRGQCGACTVLVDGQRINSCLTLAIMHDGREITTVEGLANGSGPHPMQQAFMDCDGFQCGYCTPGQVCSAVALLDEVKGRQASSLTAGDQLEPGQLSDDEIRERMSGNLCRCGAYPNIVKAIRSVVLRQA
jgi:xanthine dehydrogenase YagT iron-sulfur-binding subunit